MSKAAVTNGAVPTAAASVGKVGARAATIADAVTAADYITVY